MANDETARPAARPPTPYERFLEATKQVIAVSKEELAKREAAWRERRKGKRKS
jgi:hypothetical protein